MMFEPLASQREVLMTERRTAWTYVRRSEQPGGRRYPSAETIVLVQDNLNAINCLAV